MGVKGLKIDRREGKRGRGRVNVGFLPHGKGSRKTMEDMKKQRGKEPNG